MSLSAVLTKANTSQKRKDLKQRKSQLHDQRVSDVKLILFASNTCITAEFHFSCPENGHRAPATTIPGKRFLL